MNNTLRVSCLMAFLLLTLTLSASSLATQGEGRQKGKQGGSTQTTQAANKGPAQCDPNMEICGHDEGHQDPPINARLSLKEPDSSHIDYDQDLVVSCPAMFWSKFTFKARKNGTWYYRIISSNLNSKNSLNPYYPVDLKVQGEQQTIKFEWQMMDAIETRRTALIRFQLLSPVEAKKKKVSHDPSESEPEIIKISGKDYVVGEEKRLRVSCGKASEQSPR